MKLFILALCLFGIAGRGEGGRGIVLLGDSLSDNGNGVAATDKLVLQTTDTYPQAPYYAGRWSDGPVWIEFAAKTLASPLLDFASAGATSGAAISQLPPLPAGFGNLTEPTFIPSNNVFQQVDQLRLATNGTVSNKPVYVIYIGGNDFLSIAFQNTSVTAQDVADNVEKVLVDLYNRGARDFILGQYPPLGALPVFNNPLYGNFSASLVASLNQVAETYNSLLAQLASSFNQTHPGSQISTFDWGAALIQVLSKAGAYGLTNLQEPCYLEPYVPENPVPYQYPIGRGGGKECSEPSTYAFWDQLHITTVVHQGIGAAFVNQFAESVFGESVAVATPPPAKATTSPPTPSKSSTPPPPGKQGVSPPSPVGNKQSPPPSLPSKSPSPPAPISKGSIPPESGPVIVVQPASG